MVPFQLGGNSPTYTLTGVCKDVYMREFTASYCMDN